MAAQLAAPLLLEALPQGQPLRLLDACAAPGGKTAHLLELGDHEVLALDQDPQRCERIHATLQRRAASRRRRFQPRWRRWWDGRLFTAQVLLDAPCTASGIVRRHPDVPWLRRASDVPQLAAAQVRLLQALWPLLKPGGRLLYCTCSVFREEGDRADRGVPFCTAMRQSACRHPAFDTHGEHRGGQSHGQWGGR